MIQSIQKGSKSKWKPTKTKQSTHFATSAIPSKTELNHSLKIQAGF
jgi:hypothetical protein